jgi:hypothetical protein
MDALCLVGVFLLYIFVWIYLMVSGRDEGNSYTSRSSSDIYKSYGRTSSKRGRCRICSAVVKVVELPDSISRNAFEQFGLCLNCQWGIYMDNGGHF